MRMQTFLYESGRHSHVEDSYTHTWEPEPSPSAADKYR